MSAILAWSLLQVIKLDDRALGATRLLTDTFCRQQLSSVLQAKADEPVVRDLLLGAVGVGQPATSTLKTGEKLLVDLTKAAQESSVRQVSAGFCETLGPELRNQARALFRAGPTETAYLDSVRVQAGISAAFAAALKHIEVKEAEVQTVEVKKSKPTKPEVEKPEDKRTSGWKRIIDNSARVSISANAIVLRVMSTSQLTAADKEKVVTAYAKVLQELWQVDGVSGAFAPFSTRALTAEGLTGERMSPIQRDASSRMTWAVTAFGLILLLSYAIVISTAVIRWNFRPPEPVGVLLVLVAAGLGALILTTSDPGMFGVRLMSDQLAEYLNVTDLRLVIPVTQVMNGLAIAAGLWLFAAFASSAVPTLAPTPTTPAAPVMPAEDPAAQADPEPAIDSTVQIESALAAQAPNSRLFTAVLGDLRTVRDAAAMLLIMGVLEIGSLHRLAASGFGADGIPAIESLANATAMNAGLAFSGILAAAYFPALSLLTTRARGAGVVAADTLAVESQALVAGGPGWIQQLWTVAVSFAPFLVGVPLDKMIGMFGKA